MMSSRQSRVPSRASASISTRCPLRGVTVATQRRLQRTALRAAWARARGFLGAGQHRRDPHARHAIGGDGGSRLVAGADHARDARQQRRLERREAARLRRGDAGLVGKRMMEDRQEPQTMRLAEQAIAKAGEREPVDHRDRAIGQRRERRPRGLARAVVGFGEAARQLAHRDLDPARAQAVHQAPRIEIAAGELIDRPRHQQRERSHDSAPSNAAQAIGDLRKRTRRLASAPAVPGPSAPAAILRLEAAEDFARHEFGGGVAAAETRHLVEIAISELAQHLVEQRLGQADIADEAVAVELGAAKLDLHLVGRAMELLRRPENLADETMGDHDVAADRDAVHGSSSAIAHEMAQRAVGLPRQGAPSRPADRRTCTPGDEPVERRSSSSDSARSSRRSRLQRARRAGATAPTCDDSTVRRRA